MDGPLRPRPAHVHHGRRAGAARLRQGEVMTLLLIALACLAFSIYAAREVRRSHLVTMENLERARRNWTAARKDWDRAAEYSRKAAEVNARTEAIRAETEKLRRQRKETR